MVLNAMRAKKLSELVGRIFPPSIRADLLDLLASLSLSPCLIVKERFDGVRLVLKVVDTSKTRVIVNETGKVSLPSDSLCTHRSIEVRMDELENFSRTLLRRWEGGTSGFAKGASITRLFIRRINGINSLGVLRKMTQHVLARMTKATMPGLEVTNARMGMMMTTGW